MKIFLRKLRHMKENRGGWNKIVFVMPVKDNTLTPELVMGIAVKKEVGSVCSYGGFEDISQSIRLSFKIFSFEKHYRITWWKPFFPRVINLNYILSKT